MKATISTLQDRSLFDLGKGRGINALIQTSRPPQQVALIKSKKDKGYWLKLILKSLFKSPRNADSLAVKDGDILSLRPRFTDLRNKGVIVTINRDGATLQGNPQAVDELADTWKVRLITLADRFGMDKGIEQILKEAGL